MLWVDPVAAQNVNEGNTAGQTLLIDEPIKFTKLGYVKTSAPVVQLHAGGIGVVSDTTADDRVGATVLACQSTGGVSSVSQLTGHVATTNEGMIDGDENNFVIKK